jgi:hypothetical protein
MLVHSSLNNSPRPIKGWSSLGGNKLARRPSKAVDPPKIPSTSSSLLLSPSHLDVLAMINVFSIWSSRNDYRLALIPTATHAKRHRSRLLSLRLACCALCLYSLRVMFHKLISAHPLIPLSPPHQCPSLLALTPFHFDPVWPASDDAI